MIKISVKNSLKESQKLFNKMTIVLISKPYNYNIKLSVFSRNVLPKRQAVFKVFDKSGL